MTDQLVFEVKDRIATIRLNRPDRYNAFTHEMLKAWADALRECRDRDDIYVIVLTGTGKGFCSGGDVGNMKNRSEESAYQRRSFLTDFVHQIPLLLEEIDKPVIVAVNGVATGAGMDMALMGDLRVAARSAKFAETYVKVGLFAGDGGSWYLPRLVGKPKALELLWTARWVSAEEAERIGIVNRVVDDEDLMAATYELAQQIAAQPPIAIRLIKRAVRQGERIDIRTHLDMAGSHMAAMYSTKDHKEAVSAFVEKRTPTFKGE
ncbi:enoyl-CoA hydratase/isomerase family protein [Orrella sp. 11846]|uniref:enoyl-CoA hydratase/isomerase family protein n=1 Tax=Orrella sp. 11846 TaxID=3409913 RepID=UPI003B5AE706